jgi:hypothetical protein
LVFATKLQLSTPPIREGQIAQLVEKDLQSKLGLLFKKNFYDVAVKIARSQQYDKVSWYFSLFLVPVVPVS